MKTYSCKVRLRGNVQDEVRKVGVTEAEIAVIQVAHNGVANEVVEIVELPESQWLRRREADSLDNEGNVLRGADLGPWTEADERDRLNHFYTEPLVLQVFGRAMPRISADPVKAAADASLPRARRSAIDPLAA